MTPKDKAWDIYSRMMFGGFYALNKTDTKQCALIAVEYEYNAKIQAYNELYEFCPDVASQAAIYAELQKQEVKKEIELL